MADLTEAEIKFIQDMEARDPLSGQIARIYVRPSDRDKEIARAEMKRMVAGEASND